MEILGQINITTLVLLCGGACLLAVFLFIILPIFSGILNIVFSVLDVFLSLFQAGPLPGCGCVMVLAGCACTGTLAVVLIDALSTCNTADPVNFCRFF
ncbi:MAG: hypothetical protein EA396_06325 [Anaerolineaceae bacterium]|nr:MAG: hypothetical protein EA396_06325 [Anaerolineaceae bacterium]